MRPHTTGRTRAAAILFGPESLVFADQSGGLIYPHDFRGRVFVPLVRRVLGRSRRFTPHSIRHTFARLHLARATNL
jgi:integrase